MSTRLDHWSMIVVLLTLVLVAIEAGVLAASVNLTLISHKSNYLGEQTPEHLDEIYDLMRPAPAGSTNALRRAKNLAAGEHNGVPTTVLSSNRSFWSQRKPLASPSSSKKLYPPRASSTGQRPAIRLSDLPALVAVGCH